MYDYARFFINTRLRRRIQWMNWSTYEYVMLHLFYWIYCTCPYRCQDDFLVVSRMDCSRPCRSDELQIDLGRGRGPGGGDIVFKKNWLFKNWFHYLKKLCNRVRYLYRGDQDNKKKGVFTNIHVELLLVDDENVSRAPGVLVAAAPIWNSTFYPKHSEGHGHYFWDRLEFCRDPLKLFVIPPIFTI